MSDAVEVRGNATAEELAAVLAALRRDPPANPPQCGQDSYEQWRATRLAALRIPEGGTCRGIRRSG